MSTRDGWATIPHERGEGATVARALLDLAEDPRDVVYVPGRSEFTAPDALAEAYRKSVAPKRRSSKRENADNG